MQTIKNSLLELLGRNDLLKASLLVGKVQNLEFESTPYVDTVLELASQVWHGLNRARKDPILKVEMINQVLFEEWGMQGKPDRARQVIDDPNRYFLHSVLEQKQGSPLSLAILYCILADQIGLKCECLALPSSYILRVSDVVRDFYVDPFDLGRLMTQDEFQKKLRTAMQRHRMLSAKLFEKATAWQLVARLVQQLKHIYILKGNAADALRAVELLTALYPQSPELTRDRGILYCEMEYFSKAVEDLKFYLKQRPDADDVGEIKKLASMLKDYREIMN